MESKRVIRGNFTTVPTGSDVLSIDTTNAVTASRREGAGNTPLSRYECVVEAREFMEENKK